MCCFLHMYFNEKYFKHRKIFVCTAFIIKHNYVQGKYIFSFLNVDYFLFNTLVRININIRPLSLKMGLVDIILLEKSSLHEFLL